MRLLAGVIFLGAIIWIVGLPFLGVLILLMILGALGKFVAGGK